MFAAWDRPRKKREVDGMPFIAVSLVFCFDLCMNRPISLLLICSSTATATNHNNISNNNNNVVVINHLKRKFQRR